MTNNGSLHSRKQQILAGVQKRISDGERVYPSDYIGYGNEVTRWVEEYVVSATTPLQSEEQVLPGYKLLQLIGANEFGAVYTAVPTTAVRRMVAIKFFDSSSPSLLSDFLKREREMLERHQPSAAVRIVECMRNGERDAVVMELVYGVSISRFVKNRELDINQRLKLLIELTKSIEEIHSLELSHGALTSSNVLIAPKTTGIQIRLSGLGLPRNGIGAELDERKKADASSFIRLSNELLSESDAVFANENIEPLRNHATDIGRARVELSKTLNAIQPY